MKLLPLLLLFSSLALSLRAQDPAAKPGDPFLKENSKPLAPKQETKTQSLLFVFERYAVKKEDYVALRDELQDESARYARINEHVKKGTARLEHLSMALGRSGNRFGIESVHEFRFPTQFAATTSPKAAADPLTWETRNLGNTEELEFTAFEDNQGGNVQSVVQNVRFLGYHDCAAEPGNPYSVIAQPRFRTRKLSSNRSLSYHMPTLLGVVPSIENSDKQNAGELELWYIHVRPVVMAEVTAVPAPVRPISLHLEYTFYNMERAVARKLVLENKTEASLQTALRLLLENKQAVVDSTSTLITGSGYRTISESIAEVRFGTEMNPPMPPANPQKPEDRNPATFTAFETRNTGITVEVEPTLGPDYLTVDLLHAPQFVLEVPEEKPTGILAKYPPQPHFESSKLTTNMACRVGESTLVGSFNPVGDAGAPGRTDSGQVRLGFLKVRTE